MTLTLHKSQVHCSGVMQWRLAVHSTPLPAEGGYKTCERFVPVLAFIA